jgi:hypothetical protein
MSQLTPHLPHAVSCLVSHFVGIFVGNFVEFRISRRFDYRLSTIDYWLLAMCYRLLIIRVNPC